MKWLLLPMVFATSLFAEEELTPQQAHFFEQMLADASITPLQKHLLFFDINGDGWVTYAESVHATRQLGLPAWKTMPVMALIHLFLGPKTSSVSGAIGNGFAVDIRNIINGKHAGDTGVYGNDGQLDWQRFDVEFGAYLNGPQEMLTWSVAESLRKLRNGGFDARLEWSFLFDIAADVEWVDADGTIQRALSKKRLKQFYDGTLFFRLVLDRAKNYDVSWARPELNPKDEL